MSLKGDQGGRDVRVGDVTLLAMDDQMRQLRPVLRWVLGFDAHAYVDGTLEVITAGDPLLLVGPPACEQRYLAEQIHDTSARRSFGFAPFCPRCSGRRANQQQGGSLAPVGYRSDLHVAGATIP